MRRLIAWLGAAFGVVALYRLLTRRPKPVGESEGTAEVPAVDSRAEELRQKLAETRVLVHERDEFEEGETSVDRADPEEADPDRRRRDVHARGRAAADEMRSPGRGDS